MKGESFVILFQVISGVKVFISAILNSFKKDTIMTQIAFLDNFRDIPYRKSIAKQS